MFLEFNLPNQPRPRWRHVLNLPMYVLAFLLGVAFPYWQPYSFFLVSLLAGLVYTFVYARSLRFFLTLQPQRPAWQFIGIVVVAQLVVLSATLYLMAA